MTIYRRRPAFGSSVVCTAFLLWNLPCWAAAASVDRIYVFGDSYSDTGAGYVDGDGPTAVAYLAQRLGIELRHANAPDTAGKSLNFAVSGAQTGNGSGRRVKGALLGYGMRNQVDDFAVRVRSGAIAFKSESTLFFIAGGLNDRTIPTETTVQNLKGLVNTLYELGGRRFVLAILPTAIPSFSAVGKRLNPALSKIPQELAAELQEGSFGSSRWGQFFDEVMANPTQYGITNTTSACAGRTIFDEDATPCAKPAASYYYHAGHPSTAVHKVVGDKIYQELTGLSSPPGNDRP
jgi:phospholipase/lecithinase/hemolysin